MRESLEKGCILCRMGKQPINNDGEWIHVEDDLTLESCTNSEILDTVPTDKDLTNLYKEMALSFEKLVETFPQAPWEDEDEYFTELAELISNKTNEEAYQCLKK